MDAPELLRRGREHARDRLLAAGGLLASVVLGYAVGTHSPLVAALVGIVAIAGTVWIWPSTALIALPLLYLLPRTLDIGGLHPRDLVAGSFALTFLGIMRRPSFSDRIVMSLGLVMAFAIAVAVSAIGFISQPGETAALAEIVASCIILIAGVGIGSTSTRGLSWTVIVVRLIVVGVAVTAIVLWFRKGANAADLLIGERGRADALLGPNGLGAFLAIGTVLEITIRRNHIVHLRSLIVIGVLMTAVFLTGSRGAILVLGVSLVATLLLWRRRAFAVLMAALLIPATALLIGTLTSARVEGAVQAGVSPESIEASPHLRIGAARLALHLMATHPLTGVGYGQAVAYAPSDPQLGVELDTHNEYLRIGAESGIPSLLLLVALFALCLRIGSRYALSTRSSTAAGALIAAFGFAVSLTLVQGFRSFEFSAPWMLLMGALVGGSTSRSAVGPPKPSA